VLYPSHSTPGLPSRCRALSSVTNTNTSSIQNGRPVQLSDTNLTMSHDCQSYVIPARDDGQTVKSVLDIMLPSTQVDISTRIFRPISWDRNRLSLLQESQKRQDRAMELTMLLIGASVAAGANMILFAGATTCAWIYFRRYRSLQAQLARGESSVDLDGRNRRVGRDGHGRSGARELGELESDRADRYHPDREQSRLHRESTAERRRRHARSRREEPSRSRRDESSLNVEDDSGEEAPRRESRHRNRNESTQSETRRNAMASRNPGHRRDGPYGDGHPVA
jgi:hypothetical protein